MFLLLLNGRWYEAGICDILLPLRCILGWEHFGQVKFFAETTIIATSIIIILVKTPDYT